MENIIRKMPKVLRDILAQDEKYRNFAMGYKITKVYDFEKRSDVATFKSRIAEKFEIGNTRSKKELKPANGLYDLDRTGIHLK